jgi:hypothetical protein
MTGVHEYTAAGRPARRMVFRRVIAAFLLAFLGSFSVAYANSGCVPKGCATCCRLSAIAGDHGVCMRQCLGGEGECGVLVALGCPLE